MVNNSKESKMTQPIIEGIPLTASDWSLYSGVPGSTSAAIKIGRALSDALRKHLTADIAFDSSAKYVARITVYKEVWAVMESLDKFGATDTEPRGILNDLVNKAFNWK